MPNQTSYDPVTIATKTRFSPDEVRKIAEAIGIPSSAQESEVLTAIAKFDKKMKQEGHNTVAKAIAALTPQSAPVDDRPHPSAPVSGNVSFSGFDSQSIVNALQAQQQHTQNRASLEKISGMMERLAELTSRAEGRNRLDLLLSGAEQPESPIEVQILLMAREILGYNQSVLPDFLAVDSNGNLQIDFQKMLAPAGTIEAGLSLLPAAIEARTVPILPPQPNPERK